MLKHIPFYASLLGRDLADGIKATTSYVLVYGAIEAHSLGEKGCIASNARVAEETGLTVGSVRSIVSRLHKSGWIDVHLGKNNVRLSIDPLMCINTPLTPINAPVDPHQPENTAREGKEKTGVPAPNVAGNPQLFEIVEHVRLIQGLNPWVNKSKQYQFAKKILSSYSIADAKSAADRMLDDPYWKSKGFDLGNLAGQIHRYGRKEQPAPFLSFNTQGEPL